MATEMGVSEIGEFLSGPLVTWLASCLETPTGEKLSYEDVVDGVLVHAVFQQTSVCYEKSDVVPTGGDVTRRARNLFNIVENLRQFYEEELKHVIVRAPDVARLAKQPEAHVQEAKLMLCLLLGCAVNCGKKRDFIDGIQQLEVQTQQDIVSLIAQVVYVPNIVLSPDMLLASVVEAAPEVNHATNVQLAFEHMRVVCRERDRYREELRALTCRGREDVAEPELQEPTARREDEVQEARSRLHGLQEELDKRSDELHESRELNEQYRRDLDDLHRENKRLVAEARSAKSYRDMLDAVTERAERADRLEQEIARYKEKLEDATFYKTRLNELLEDKQLLIESKEVLLEQVNTYKVKADRILDLEQQMFGLKQQVNDLTLENAAHLEKCRQLSEENAQLENLVKTSTQEALESGFVIDSDESSLEMDSSLSEQLTNSAHSQALKLELENRRLSSMIDSLKEESFHESSSKLLDLEKDKKKLSLTVEALREELDKLARKNEELEGAQKRLSEEEPEARALAAKFATLEKKHLQATKEKKRLRSLLESVQKRCVELERSLSLANQKLEERKLAKEAAGESLAGRPERRPEGSTDTVRVRKRKSGPEEALEPQNQCAALKRALGQLAAEKEILLKAREKLGCDQEHLKRLHDQLNLDYQQVVQERNGLRAQMREARTQAREQSEALESLRAECAQLKATGVRLEHAQLKEDFGRLFKANESLLAKFRAAKAELESRAGHGDELRAKNQMIVELEVRAAKLEHSCQVLGQMKEGLERDKRSLMDQFSQLMKQHHELITQSLEDREHYHMEERKSTDRLIHLTRQKEKLEDKIMEQYRSCPAKKRSLGASIVKNTFVKVRRAGSELLNRSRRSWAEESAPAAERSYDFEYTRGTDSDASLEEQQRRVPRQSLEPRSRKSLDYLDERTLEQLHSSRTRKSLDLAELFFLGNSEENEELDVTLHDEDSAPHAAHDISTFSRNKSIDLSFETEDEPKEEDLEEKHLETHSHSRAKAKPRHDIWLEFGCV